MTQSSEDSETVANRVLTHLITILTSQIRREFHQQQRSERDVPFPRTSWKERYPRNIVDLAYLLRMKLDLESWEPLPVDEVAELLTEASFKWWISGGYALELYAGGRWRHHDDLDVGICRYKALAVHGWLREWDLWVAAAGELSSWKGRPLKVEEDENNVWARRSSQQPWR